MSCQKLNTANHGFDPTCKTSIPLFGRTISKDLLACQCERRVDYSQDRSIAKPTRTRHSQNIKSILSISCRKRKLVQTALKSADLGGLVEVGAKMPRWLTLRFILTEVSVEASGYDEGHRNDPANLHARVHRWGCCRRGGFGTERFKQYSRYGAG